MMNKITFPHKCYEWKDQVMAAGRAGEGRDDINSHCVPEKL